MISTISKLVSVLFHFIPTSLTVILLESQWGCPQVFYPQAMAKKQQAVLGPRLLLAVDEWRWSLTAYSSVMGFHAPILAVPSALQLLRSQCYLWGWGVAVQTCLLRTLTSNSMAGTSGWCSSLCSERDSVPVCLKGKGERWLLFVFPL